VIYNPKAGTWLVKKRWKAIREYMDTKHVSYDYFQSEGFGSVERLARTLADNGYRTIVIVGGDGALNDAINGIMSSNVEGKDDISIGIIPNGIANDFAKYWGMSWGYKDAVDRIIKGRRKKIDVGYVRYFNGKTHERRFFLNAVNIGLGARIVQMTDLMKRVWGLKLLYYITAFFLLLFERKLYRMHLTINGEHIHGRIMTVCAGNASGYGQTPSAVPYNGYLDVSIIYRPQLFQIVQGLVMLIRRRILNSEVVRIYRTKKIKVIRAKSAAVSLDGRLLAKRSPFEIGVKPEAITVIIP
jgi:YegS/Rv2252/BmrU family lipid kinase